jgi:hypothetical protein
MSIDDRYTELMWQDTATLQRWAYMTNVDKGTLIVEILQREYDKSTFNTWASAHGVRTIP